MLASLIESTVSPLAVDSLLVRPHTSTAIRFCQALHAVTPVLSALKNIKSAALFTFCRSWSRLLAVSATC